MRAIIHQMSLLCHESTSHERRAIRWASPRALSFSWSKHACSEPNSRFVSYRKLARPASLYGGAGAILAITFTASLKVKYSSQALGGKHMASITTLRHCVPLPCVCASQGPWASTFI